jgi:predicted porin
MGGGSDTRAKNVVAYISPSFSGLSFAGAYSTDLDTASTGNAGDLEDRAVWNVNATYSNGPLYLGAAYGDGDGHDALGLEEHWRLAAGFSFGDFRVVGQYDSLADATPAAGTGDYDAWMLGASYTMGNIVLKANYMDGDYDLAADPEQWTIGADYNLSKRTSVYALYASGENVTLGGGAGASDRVASGVVGGDISAISLGVVHSF